MSDHSEKKKDTRDRRAYLKDYRRRNKERDNETKRRWAEGNRDKVVAARMKWLENNKEKAKESKRKWASKNKARALDTVRAWKKKNPDKVQDSYLKRAYGIDLDRYNLILKEQDGVCAICSEPPSKRYLCVDHCHETGVVRGLLCNQCNGALGYLKESEANALKLIEYIRKYKEKTNV